MPKMNGYEASKFIIDKIQNEGYQNCRIIGYTALLGNVEEKKCLEAGMCDTILKPATYEDLKNKILSNL